MEERKLTADAKEYSLCLNELLKWKDNVDIRAISLAHFWKLEPEPLMQIVKDGLEAGIIQNAHIEGWVLVRKGGGAK